MDYSHHMAVRELDLSACHPSSVVDKVVSVPALKTSAAFFTFLRANLALSSAMSSATNTPQFGPTSPYNIVPASHSPLCNTPLVPLDDIPPLSLEVLEDRHDKVESLHLIADSIAQMRQRASMNLVFHPLCVAGLSAALASVYQFGYVSKSELGLAITVSCGVVMSYLMGIRYFTSGYITLAEQLRWKWLQAEDGEEDMVLGARYDDEIISTLVLRLETNPIFFMGKKRKGSISLRGGKGVIRAWTTLLKYRGRGVGKDLLHEAVKITKERCGKDAEVGFAKEHANSAMLLPSIFNAPFRMDEIRATRTLENVLADWELVKKRR